MIAFRTLKYNVPLEVTRLANSEIGSSTTKVEAFSSFALNNWTNQK